MKRALRGGHRSRSEAECIGVMLKASADPCDERNTGEMAHSRLAGQEM